MTRTSAFLLMALFLAGPLPLQASLQCSSLFAPNPGLSENLEHFLETHPERTSFIKGVKFHFDAHNSQSRNLLIIQFKGDQDPIVSSYLKMLGENSISFPTSERTEHLYVRVEDKVYDFYEAVHGQDYRIRAKRLETVIELSPREAKVFKEYIKQSSQDEASSLGGFDAKGPRAGQETARDLNDNRFKEIGCKHNCTSWLSMAPIGQRSEYLIELLGGGTGGSIHKRAAQWIHWLVGASPSERIPFIVLWTTRPIEKVAAEIQRGQLRWDFGQRSDFVD